MKQSIEPWFNGNTADFGSVIPGSSPGGSTNPQKLSYKPPMHKKHGGLFFDAFHSIFALEE